MKTRTVSVQMAKADYGRLGEALGRRAQNMIDWPSRLEPMALCTFAFLAVLAIGAVLGLPQTATIAAAVAAAAGAAYWSTGRIRRRLMLRSLRADGAFLRPFRFTADEDGLHIASDVLDSKLRWGGVFGIETTRDLVLVYVDRANAIALPLAAFPDVGGMNAYADELRYLRRRAQETRKDAAA
jgi:hypothetical protein